MTNVVHNLSEGSPWLKPDALWRKACQIVARGGYATCRRDGKLVQRAVRCVRQLDRALTDRMLRRTACDYPDVYWALHLQREMSPRVLELKARVLAGQSDEVIARLLGLPRRTVTTFVAMFFDIRSSLKAGTWIRRVVIGVPLDQGPSVESLLLLHAWKRGPTVVEPWLDYLKHQEERHDLHTDVGRQRAWIEYLIRVQQLPFEPRCLKSLWKLSPFILGKSPKVITSTTVGTTILQHRARVLGEIAWNVRENQEFEELINPVRGLEPFENREERGFAKAG